MKKILLSFCFLSFLLTDFAFGQYCDQPTEFRSTIDVWDWTQETFTVYLTGVNQNQTTELIINSPFYGNLVGQPNTDHLASAIDKPFFPNDGWELVVKEFGNPDVGVRMPAFILYNRLSGKLRIFYYLADKDGVDQVNMGVRNYSDASIKYISALLESAANTPMVGLENYVDHSHIISTPNVFEGNAGLWLFAEMPTTYDPCTCQYPSALQIETESVNVQEFTLELDGEGTLNQIVAGGQNMGNNQRSINVSNIAGAAKKGSTAFKSIDGLIDKVDKSFATKINNNLNPAMISSLQNAGFGNSVDPGEVNDIYNFAAGGSDEQFSQFFNNFSLGGFSASIPPELKTAIPYIGAAATVMSFFSSAPADPPLNFSIDLNFTGGGEITDQSSLQSFKFSTPGANHDGVNPTWTPIYDNVLGVANIVEIPT